MGAGPSRPSSHSPQKQPAPPLGASLPGKKKLGAAQLRGSPTHSCYKVSESNATFDPDYIRALSRQINDPEHQRKQAAAKHQYRTTGNVDGMKKLQGDLKRVEVAATRQKHA
jgi:hypothetical protein